MDTSSSSSSPPTSAAASSKNAKQGSKDTVVITAASPCSPADLLCAIHGPDMVGKCIETPLTTVFRNTQRALSGEEPSGREGCSKLHSQSFVLAAAIQDTSPSDDPFTSTSNIDAGHFKRQSLRNAVERSAFLAVYTHALIHKRLPEVSRYVKEHPDLFRNDYRLQKSADEFLLAAQPASPSEPGIAQGAEADQEGKGEKADTELEDPIMGRASNLESIIARVEEHIAMTAAFNEERELDESQVPSSEDNGDHLAGDADSSDAATSTAPSVHEQGESNNPAHSDQEHQSSAGDDDVQELTKPAEKHHWSVADIMAVDTVKMLSAATVLGTKNQPVLAGLLFHGFDVTSRRNAVDAFLESLKTDFCVELVRRQTEILGKQEEKQQHLESALSKNTASTGATAPPPPPDATTPAAPPPPAGSAVLAAPLGSGTTKTRATQAKTTSPVATLTNDELYLRGYVLKDERHCVLGPNRHEGELTKTKRPAASSKKGDCEAKVFLYSCRDSTYVFVHLAHSHGVNVQLLQSFKPKPFIQEFCESQALLNPTFSALRTALKNQQRKWRTENDPRFTPESLIDRRFYPTDQFLYNLLKKKRARTQFHQHDPTSVEALIKTWTAAHPEDRIFHHIPAAGATGKDAVVKVVIQTKFMQTMMKHATTFGIDAFYKSVHYKYSVFLLMAYDNSRMGQIIGIIICSDEDTPTLADCLHIFKSWNEHWKPTYAVTDKCEIERNALRQVFPGIKLILCEFHRLKAIWEYIRSHTTAKIGATAKDTELYRKEIFAKVQELAWARDQAHYDLLKRNLLEDTLKTQPNIAAYLKSEWFTCEDDWLPFRRTSTFKMMTTNNVNERANRTMKQQYKATGSKRLDALLLVMLTVNSEHYKKKYDEQNMVSKGDYEGSKGAPDRLGKEYLRLTRNVRKQLSPVLEAAKVMGKERIKHVGMAIYYVRRSDSYSKYIELRQLAAAKTAPPGQSVQVTFPPNHEHHTVNTGSLSCTCDRRRWSGLPCIHLFAVMYHCNIPWPARMPCFLDLCFDGHELDGFQNRVVSKLAVAPILYKTPTKQSSTAEVSDPSDDLRSHDEIGAQQSVDNSPSEADDCASSDPHLPTLHTEINKALAYVKTLEGSLHSVRMLEAEGVTTDESSRMVGAVQSVLQVLTEANESLQKLIKEHENFQQGAHAEFQPKRRRTEQHPRNCDIVATSLIPPDTSTIGPTISVAIPADNIRSALVLPFKKGTGRPKNPHGRNVFPRHQETMALLAQQTASGGPDLSSSQPKKKTGSQQNQPKSTTVQQQSMVTSTPTLRPLAVRPLLSAPTNTTPAPISSSTSSTTTTTPVSANTSTVARMPITSHHVGANATISTAAGTVGSTQARMVPASIVPQHPVYPQFHAIAPQGFRQVQPPPSSMPLTQEQVHDLWLMRAPQQALFPQIARQQAIAPPNLPTQTDAEASTPGIPSQSQENTERQERMVQL